MLKKLEQVKTLMLLKNINSGSAQQLNKDDFMSLCFLLCEYTYYVEILCRLGIY